MSEILCHIAGPSGCGKSSLMRRLQEKFTEFEFKDLDDFDDEVLGKKVASKEFMSNEEFNKFFDKKQVLLDRFVKGAKRPIVLVGIHTELPRKYEFLTLNKFLINCTAETAAFQAIVRSRKGNETHSNHFLGAEGAQDLWKRKNQAQRDILWLCRQGYVIKANQEIENFLLDYKIKKKIKLSRYTPLEHNSTHTNEDGSQTTYLRASSNYGHPVRYGQELTKDIIDSNQNYCLPTMVVTNSNYPDARTSVVRHLNNLASNLKYVIPTNARSHPATVVDVSGNGNGLGESYIPDNTGHSFRYGISTHQDDLEDHLKDYISTYAGDIFHSILGKYDDTYPKEQSNLRFPAIDEMLERGKVPGIEDIEHDHYTPLIRNPWHSNFRDPDSQDPSKEREYSVDETPFTQQIRDLALVARDRGKKLYRSYLDSKHKGSFQDFLEDHLRVGYNDKEHLLHDLILQMTQGFHLPEKTR